MAADSEAVLNACGIDPLEAPELLVALHLAKSC